MLRQLWNWHWNRRLWILSSVLIIALGVTGCDTDDDDDADGRADCDAGCVDGLDGADGANGADGRDGQDGLPGADGKDGADGANGTNGKDGADGEDGEDGLPGDAGADGEDGIGVVDGMKNVILIIGDGMQKEHEIAASRYLFGTDDGLSFHDDTTFAYRNWVTTWDTTTYDRYASWLGVDPYDPNDFDPFVGYDPARGGDGAFPDVTVPDENYFMGYYADGDAHIMSAATPATDSASAATAMATGVKTEKGNISWAPGDEANGALETIGEWMRDEMDGSFGVVSTVEFSHATPAAFASHNVARGNYGEIADEIVFDSQPDVVIGAGHPHWSGGSVFQPRFSYITEAGYNALKTNDDSNPYIFVERETGEDGSFNLDEAKTDAISDGKKLFGLFGGSGKYMEHPVPADAPGNPGFTEQTDENPTLSESTDAALDVLGEDSDGFFLMVEGGDIDWANHGNDFAWMIGAMHQFSEAVDTAVKWVDDNSDWDDTLLIVTSDHGNSYLRLNSAKLMGDGELPAQTENNGSNCSKDFCGDCHDGKAPELVGRC